jgi:hypothetical protein
MTDSEKRQIVRDFERAIIERGNWQGCAPSISDRMRYDECADCPHCTTCTMRADYNDLIEKVRTTRDATRALHGFTN